MTNPPAAEQDGVKASAETPLYGAAGVAHHALARSNRLALVRAASERLDTGAAFSGSHFLSVGPGPRASPSTDPSRAHPRAKPADRARPRFRARQWPRRAGTTLA